MINKCLNTGYKDEKNSSALGKGPISFTLYIVHPEGGPVPMEMAAEERAHWFMAETLD